MTSGPEHGEPVSLGFDIADGEQVELAYGGDQLVLRFVDWHEQPIRATFQGTVASDGNALSASTRGNASTARMWCANPHGSPSIAVRARLLRSSHLKLNFNAAGVLEVICLGVAVQ
jgi:hypothetical protein